MKLLQFLSRLTLLYTTLSVIFCPLEMALGEEKNSLSEEQKIDKLLEAVAKADGTFLRNGDEHKPKKARDHLKFKYSRAKNMFWFFGPSKDIKASEFIEKIASKSSSTGKDYQIKLKNGKILPLGEWLNEELKKIEGKN